MTEGRAIYISPCMTKTDIITQLAQARTVEALCQNVARSSIMSADLEDLAQYVYLVLLEYDEGKVLSMWEGGSLRFFLARIIVNQYRSKTSPFHRVFREFRQRCEDYAPGDYDAAKVYSEMYL